MIKHLLQKKLNNGKKNYLQFTIEAFLLVSISAFLAKKESVMKKQTMFLQIKKY
jgi:hypothetical protein